MEQGYSIVTMDTVFFRAKKLSRSMTQTGKTDGKNAPVQPVLAVFCGQLSFGTAKGKA